MNIRALAAWIPAFGICFVTCFFSSSNRKKTKNLAEDTEHIPEVVKGVLTAALDRYSNWLEGAAPQSCPLWAPWGIFCVDIHIFILNIQHKIFGTNSGQESEQKYFPKSQTVPSVFIMSPVSLSLTLEHCACVTILLQRC